MYVLPATCFGTPTWMVSVVSPNAQLLTLPSSLIAMIPPTVYYGKVGLELAKIVARGQKMSPPYVPVIGRCMYAHAHLVSQ